MVRLSEELRVLAVLIFSLAFALGSGSVAMSASPDVPAGLHDIAGVQHASILHNACVHAPCSDQTADCCSSVAQCCGAGCTAVVAPVEPPGFMYSLHRAWTLAGARCLKGLDPLVSRHPPRDLA